MIRSIPQRILTPRMQSVFRQFHGRVTSASSAIETENWFMFPRETEGNIYKVNWSLVGEGVTPTQNAFRNARDALLISHLSAKPSGGKVEVTKPVYSGEYQLQESGDKTLPADTFKDISVELKKNLSFSKNLYVEDAAVGSFSSVRMGVRIVSDYPELVVASRALLIQTPSRPCDHRARFDGWNLDPMLRSGVQSKRWDGMKFVEDSNPAPQKGQRPIVTFVGGDSATLAVEFVQYQGKLAGANIIAGGKAPVRGLIAAIGHASTVLVNELQSGSLALPSASFTIGKNSCVVVNADDSILDALVSNKTLYGAYNNILTSAGVSAAWNGVIGGSVASSTSTPAIISGNKTIAALTPDNLAAPATHIVFYEKGAKKATLTEEEALKKIVAVTGESKSSLAASLIKGAKLLMIGSASDLSSIA